MDANKVDSRSTVQQIRRRIRSANQRHLRVEKLEDRRMLALFTVTNLLDGPVAAADDLPGSLRQAVFDANASSGGDSIDFEAGLAGTIRLTEGQIDITDRLTIVGPGSHLIAISGNNSSRIFAVDDGTNDIHMAATFMGLTLTEGWTSGDSPDGNGGAIKSHEILSLTNMAVVDNSSGGAGGGIWVNPEFGFVYVRNSSITGNRSNRGGGGADIHLSESTYGYVKIENSTFSYNQSGLAGTADGGGLNLSADTFSFIKIWRSTFSGNSADSGGGGGINVNLGQNSHLDIARVTISSNRAQTGGGIEITGSDSSQPVPIAVSTITGNRTVGFAGSVFGGGLNLESIDLEMTYSIVAGNEDGTGSAPDIQVREGSFIPSFSLIGENTGSDLQEAPLGAPDSRGNLVGDIEGSGAIDPRLAPLGDLGGPTKVHALLQDSPALNAGNGEVFILPGFDQRGAPYKSPVGIIDIGAYEAQGTPTSAPGDYDGNGSVDTLDYSLWLSSLGSTVSPLTGADGDGDGIVGPNDYDVWKTHFGFTLPPPPAPQASESFAAEHPFTNQARQATVELQVIFAALQLPTSSPNTAQLVYRQSPTQGQDEDDLLIIARDLAAETDKEAAMNDPERYEQNEDNESIADPLQVALAEWFAAQDF